MGWSYGLREQGAAERPKQLAGGWVPSWFLRLAWVGLDFGLGWEEASCDSASSSVLAAGWLSDGSR